MNIDKSESTSVGIVPATPGDAEVICAIRDEAWLESYPNEGLDITREDVQINAQGLHGEFVPRRVAALKKKLSRASNDEVVYVSKIEGIVRGFVMASKSDHGKNFLDSIYVQPGFQGVGMGSQLMQKALDWLGDDTDTYLEVVGYNNNAIKFYNRLGFEKTDNAVEDDPRQPDYMKSIPQIEMVRRAK